MKNAMKILPALALALFLGSAHAHVVLQQKTVEAGASTKATFVVSHGCGASPTAAIIVKIPADVANAKPMAKANWVITTRKAAERVTEVAWRGGSLDPELYDEFTIVLRAPDTPGKRYFTVRQECEDAILEWSEIPGEGKTTRDYKNPAAELEVVPAATARDPGHKH
jgi:periplasmic copper chaperone A